MAAARVTFVFRFYLKRMLPVALCASCATSQSSDRVDMTISASAGAVAPEPPPVETPPQAPAPTSATEPPAEEHVSISAAPPPPAQVPERAPLVAATNEDDWPADCEAHYRFVAHGSAGAAKHSVAPGSEQTMAYYFERPWKEKEARQLLQARFTFDNSKVVHHWAFYLTSAREQPGTALDENSLDALFATADSQLLIGGGAGNTRLTLPDDVGLRVPELPNPGFWLEVHYINTSDSRVEEDASALEVCVTTKPRPHEAAAHALGKGNFQLPAKALTDVQSTCRPHQLDTPVHLVGVTPHMHARGKRTIIRLNGKTTLFDEPFDVHEQRNYLTPADTIVSPGDVLDATCQFDNTTDATITAGPGSGSEMCEIVVWAWPADRLNNGLHANPELGFEMPQDCMER